MSVKEQIHSYITKNILFGECELLQDDASFQESGILDSTGFLELITFCETNFGIEIMDDELDPEYLDSLNKIASFVERKMGGEKQAHVA